MHVIIYDINDWYYTNIQNCIWYKNYNYVWYI